MDPSKSESSDVSESETFRGRTEVSIDYASLKLKDHCPLGMYFIPSTESILIWHAAFFVHQGYYADSILKFRLKFPSNYPERPPVVQFTTDVFHPLIAQKDGTLNLSPRFCPWRPKEHRVFHVLYFIKAVFKKHALDQLSEDDCLNKEAFRLYRDSTSSFSALATQSAMLSQSASALFDSDHPSMSGKTHDILFREMKEEDMNLMRERLGLRPWINGACNVESP